MMHGVQWIKELMAMVERDKAENSPKSLIIHDRIKPLLGEELTDSRNLGMQRIKELLSGSWPGILSVEHTEDMAKFLEENPEALKKLQKEVYG